MTDTYPMEAEEAIHRARLVLEAEWGVKKVCLDKFQYSPIQSQDDLNRRVRELIDDTLFWEVG